MSPVWLVIAFAAASAAQYVILQPAIGLVYPAEVRGHNQRVDQHGAQPTPGQGYVYDRPTAQGDGFPQEAECLLTASTGSSVSGELRLSQASPGSPLRIQGTIYGLSPGLHGFHVHQEPNLGDDCKAAGPHFNPFKKQHGAPDAESRHAGDLGNVEADATGVAVVDVAADQLTLQASAAPAPDSGAASAYAVGRTVVVHARADDLGRGGDDESLRTGNAGARVACCVITQRF